MGGLFRLLSKRRATMIALVAFVNFFTKNSESQNARCPIESADTSNVKRLANRAARIVTIKMLLNFCLLAERFKLFTLLISLTVAFLLFFFLFNKGVIKRFVKHWMLFSYGLNFTHIPLYSHLRINQGSSTSGTPLWWDSFFIWIWIYICTYRAISPWI